MEVEYEENYFCHDPYCPYQDFAHHGIRVNRILRHDPQSVLDVGCAYGFIVRRILEQKVNAYGVDISRFCEKEAAKIIPGRFARCDMRKGLPFEDNTFDLLYCEGVLEHIEEEYIDFVMAEFGRVARRHILAISLEEHPEAKSHPGHDCVKPARWWVEKIPPNSCLFIPPTGTEGGRDEWVYKEWTGERFGIDSSAKHGLAEA